MSLCLAAINSARGELAFGALWSLILRSLRSITGLYLPPRLDSGLSIVSVLKSCAVMTKDVLGFLENSFKFAAVRGVRSQTGSGGVKGGGVTLIFSTVSVSCAGLGTSGLISVTIFVSIDFKDGFVRTLASFSTRGLAPESCSSNLGLAIGACSS